MKLTSIPFLLLISSPLLAGQPGNQSGFTHMQDETHKMMEPEKSSMTGVITETLNAAGYTYIKMKDGKNEIWAATSAAQLKKGDRVILEDAYPMHDFYSKTLDRNFPIIYFASGIRPNTSNVKTN